MSDERPVPLLGEVSLELVQSIEHSVNAGFASTVIGGLDGELQQRLARRSHRIAISGLLIGEDWAEALDKLQQAAASGEEQTFAADITSALDLQQVVVTSFHATEAAGRPERVSYRIELAESPPLPPPAQLEGFGGLDDFGLGDLGFDTDILGDLMDMAGDIAGAIDGALDILDALGALANLDGLSMGDVLSPLEAKVGEASGLGESFASAAGDLSRLFSG